MANKRNDAGRAKLAELVAKYPNAPIKDLAREMGMTRQWVRRLLNERGLRRPEPIPVEDAHAGAE